MQKPIIPPELFQCAMQMNDEMREAVINPNTDFMTKLLFDARLLSKKLGKDVPYWSSALFSLKMLLMDNPGLGNAEIAKQLKIPAKEVEEITRYLLPMAEITQEGGKFFLNFSNPFSRMFRK